MMISLENVVPIVISSFFTGVICTVGLLDWMETRRIKKENKETEKRIAERSVVPKK